MTKQPGANIRRIRTQLGLSQSELARRAGISRQSLLTIEQGHVPRADTALRLALALGTTVEQLFTPGDGTWAAPPTPFARWTEVGGRLILHPTTSVLADVAVRQDGSLAPLPESRPPHRVLTIAGCDPALPLVARHLERQHPGWWCDVLPVPSRRALALLQAGHVHVAGIHLFHPSGYNRPHVGPTGTALQGIRATAFEVGFAARKPRALQDWPSLWREGTVAMGAQGAETEALAHRTAAARQLGPPATALVSQSHGESARLVAEGQADLTVVPRLIADVHGLAFQPLALQPFDWVAALPLLPGVDRLLATLADPSLQAALGHLAGYSLELSGQTVWNVAAGHA
ncbi:MAG: helix-turn-helix domain-containing protein [Thermaerobacter sp.]|nr:helix-turn-helix domain-containing protein [Thermaerobacter sp.]